MTIGSLVVNLGMNIAGLQSGTNKAMATLGGLEKGIGGLKNLAIGFGGALAGMFSVGGLGLLTTQSFSLIDTNAKLARSLGVSSAQLVGLQHAAQLSGVDVGMFGEQLLKLHAKGGSIDAVARKMDSITDPTERAAYAVSVFGDEGLKLLPIFSKGSDALREMINEGRKMAGVSPMDEKLVEQANQSLIRMKGAFMGIGNTLAVTVAPYVTTFADGIRGMLPSMDELRDKIAFWGVLMKETVPVIGGVVAAMWTITGVQKAIAIGQALVLSLAGPAGWATLAMGATVAVGAYAGINSAMDGVVAAAQTAANQVGSIDHEMRNLTDSSAVLLDKINQGSADAQKRIQQLQNEMQVLQAPAEMRDLIKQRQELAALSAAGADPSELTRLHHLLNQHRELTKLQKESEDLASKMGAKLASLKSPFEKWKDDVAEIKRAFEKGIIGEGEMKKLTAKATEERDKAQKKPVKSGSSFESGRGPSGAKWGSVEAYKLIVNSGNAQAEAARQYAIAQRQLKKTEDSNRLLSRIAELLKNPKPIVEEVIDIPW